MRIAIIGSGISGLTCAYLLARQHELTVFEAADWIAGIPTPSTSIGRGGVTPWIPVSLSSTTGPIRVSSN